MPLGRRDGLSFATQTVTKDLLPAPTSNANTLIEKLATNQKLDAIDLAALSGGHACIH